MDALRSATASPGGVLGQTYRGAVKAGNLADLGFLKAAPLSDIRNTRRIRAVVSRGKLFRRAELDQLLTQAEIEARNT